MSLHTQIRRGLFSVASFALMGALVIAHGEPITPASVVGVDVVVQVEAVDAAATTSPNGGDDDSRARDRANWRTLLPSAILRTRS